MPKVEAAVSTPPYEIDRPSPKDSNEDDWNAHYLGENMDETPSLAFDRLNRVLTPVVGIGLGSDEQEFLSEFTVYVITSDEQEKTLFDIDSGDEPLVDYSTSLLVHVQSGYNGSSEQHNWKRIEPTRDGIHLYGYDGSFRKRFLDYGICQSSLRVERPATNETPTARVSFTMSHDQQVQFNSTGGVFGVPDSG